MPSLELKKDREAALQDNINIRIKGYGWEDCHTTWSKDSKKNIISVLQKRLVEIIGFTEGMVIPGMSPTNTPRQKHMTLQELWQLFSDPVAMTRRRKFRSMVRAAGFSRGAKKNLDRAMCFETYNCPVGKGSWISLLWAEWLSG